MSDSLSVVRQVKKMKTADTSTLPKSNGSSASSVKKEAEPSKRFLFIWLDPDVNQNKRIQVAKKLLEQIVPCALATNSYDECKQWLMKYNDDKRIFLIVSNKFGKKIVPHVHSLTSIIAIYVYCTDHKTHTKWAENYSKVRNVISNTKKLTQELSTDLKIFKRDKDLSSQQLLRELSISHTGSFHKKEILEKNKESQGGGLAQFQFLIIDISKRLNEPASAMLSSLVSMTENSIFIVDDSSAIDFDELPKKRTLLFVSSEFAATMHGKPEQIEAIFILEKDKNKVDHRERFESDDDLIFELADQMYQCYTKEANQYRLSGDIMAAKTNEEQANEIYRTLKKAYKSVAEDNGIIIAPSDTTSKLCQ